MKIWCKSDKKSGRYEIWISIIFIETFLEQSIWICKWVSWQCHHLTIYVFCSQKWQKPIFELWESKTRLMSTLNKCRIMFALIYYGDMLWHVWAKKKKFSKFYIQNTWKVVRRWHHQLTHLRIHIDCSRNVLLKITKIQNFMYLNPYFLSDLHQIFTVLFQMFYSFYWINLNLDQISPLNADMFQGVEFWHTDFDNINLDFVCWCLIMMC